MPDKMSETQYFPPSMTTKVNGDMISIMFQTAPPSPQSQE